MSNITTAHIIFSQSESIAPLYHKRPYSYTPPQAYVTLNLTTGEVDADYSDEFGGSIPSEGEGKILRWSINHELSGRQILVILEKFLSTFQDILDGHSLERNGSDYVPVFETDASNDALNFLSVVNQHGFADLFVSNINQATVEITGIGHIKINTILNEIVLVGALSVDGQMLNSKTKKVARNIVAFNKASQVSGIEVWLEEISHGHFMLMYRDDFLPD